MSVRLPPPRHDLAITGGVLGFGATPASVLVLHALFRANMHREVDVLWPSGLLCVTVFVVAGGWPSGLAGAAAARHVRPEWCDRRPRAAAFAGGYAGGLLGFLIVAAAIAAVLFTAALS